MKSITLALLFFSSLTVYSQEAVNLMEYTLKLGASEKKEFHFGFAAEDQVVIDLKAEKGHHLSEIAVAEYDGSILFSDMDVKKLKKQAIRIPATNIYTIRFSNLSSNHQVVRFTIKRIPKDETGRNFNSTVSWRTVYDTTYQEKKETYLVRRDTSIVNLLDQVSKVHSQTNVNGNTNTAKFKLPKNTVSWAYYIDVNQAGQKAFEEAAGNLSRLAPKIAGIPEVGPVAAIALGVTGILPAIQGNEDIQYYITDYDNVQLFLSGSAFNSLRKGLVVNTSGRMTPTPGYNGYYYICLSNDNAVSGVSVTLKVSAIVIDEQWGTQTIRVPVVTERKEAYLKP